MKCYMPVVICVIFLFLESTFNCHVHEICYINKCYYYYYVTPSLRVCCAPPKQTIFSVPRQESQEICLWTPSWGKSNLFTYLAVQF